MKKSFWIAFLIIFLGAISSGIGIFLAEKNLKNSKKGLVDNLPKDDLSIIKDNIKDGGIKLPYQEPPPVSSENISESSKTEDSIEKDTLQEEVVNKSMSTVETNKLSFGILGDTQSSSFKPASSFYKAIQILKEKNPDFLVATGDLVSSCDGTNECQSKMNSWKNVLGSLFSKTYAVMGNHDRTGGSKADKLWQDFFNFPANGPTGFSELVYSLDIKNAHLVFLNSDKPEENIINSEQRDWLKKDLQSNSKELTFVFFHEPAYPISSKEDESLDVDKKDRDELWDILSNEKVTAVFSGHEHIASRKKIDGTYQFVFGNTDSFNHDLPKAGEAEYSYQGKSFGWVEIVDKKITVNTLSTDGKTLNSFSLPL